jgi:hypothetical protein
MNDEWINWLAERPSNIRELAERIPPWKKYRNLREPADLCNVYQPVSYSEHEDGTVSVRCEKTNETYPFLVIGRCVVFGMKAEDLIEIENQGA